MQADFILLNFYLGKSGPTEEDERSAALRQTQIHANVNDLESLGCFGTTYEHTTALVMTSALEMDSALCLGRCKLL